MVNYLKNNASHISRKLGYRVDTDVLEGLLKSFQEILTDTDFGKTQLVHNDFVRGNILFSSEKIGDIYPITGIIDFEKMLVGSPLIDVGRTLAFLHVDCKYKSVEEINRYFIDEGYGKISVNSVLLQVYWYIDFWKFLQSNPYESLNDNEHFIRTVKLLEECKCIIADDSK
ncbi:MAG TPA: aminoglycoside phosphotransferase family protein [bacterium]|nr:aminoglycoside phosphotransferase family protein [bacterium]